MQDYEPDKVVGYNPAPCRLKHFYFDNCTLTTDLIDMTDQFKKDINKQISHLLAAIVKVKAEIAILNQEKSRLMKAAGNEPS